MNEPVEPKRRFNPWPWFAPAFLAVVVVANIFVIHFALSTEDELVREDWYEAGLHWGQEQAEEQPAPEAQPAE